MDYHLKPIAKTCQATGELLVPGSRCFSVLVEQEGQLVRIDYSESGWTGPPEAVVGFWQSVVPDDQETKAKPLDADALMRYFEQMAEEANPAQEKFLYVLALLLLQKRRLKIEGSRQEGDVECLQLIGSQGEGPFEVRDQHLSGEEIEQLQQNLDTQFTSEWQ